MPLHTIYKQRIDSLLAFADVRIGGDQPWDLQVHNPETYGRTLGEGTIGFGEAYMDECLSVFGSIVIMVYLTILNRNAECH